MEKHLQTAKPRNRKRVLLSIVGTKVAYLKVLKERRTKHGLGKAKFDIYVECVCGAKKWVEERSVRRGLTKSCGSCVHKTHGASKTPEYAVWRSMTDRCRLSTHQAYANYGGRGITVCKRWEKFENFIADMGNKPFKGASVDRINNNKGYSKTNCRWVNATEQCRNKRTNVFLTAKGMTKTVTEWSSISGVRHNTISYRLANGWSVVDAIFAKPNFANKKQMGN